jgi:hypothetical protein
MRLVPNYTTLRDLAAVSNFLHVLGPVKISLTCYTSEVRAVRRKLKNHLLSNFGCCIFNISTKL